LFLPVLAALLATASAARAQPFPPHVGYVFPAGGRRGETVRVKVGGQYLRGVREAFVSGEGVRAEVVEYVKPMDPREFNELREKIRDLMKQRPMSADVREQMAGIRKQLLTFDRNAHPGLVDTVLVDVTIAPDAAPGRREVRLGTPRGITNPLVFYVGTLPECAETETDNPSAYPGSSGYGKAPEATRVEHDTDVTLPTVINGRIMPGDVDRYRFRAAKGQRLVARVSARDLMPYLADAVPGWFQATLALYDADGEEVAYADDYGFHPDPVLAVEVPADGEFVLEIRDAIYRGRKDFVYRIALGELPFVTGLFPLGGRAGTTTEVEVSGWNLPVTRLTQDARAPGIDTVTVRQGEWLSNPRPFAVDTLPECREKEPDARPQETQSVTPPVIVNGRIGRPGDADVFRFTGRAGETVVAEVVARRLESPLDATLRLTDAAGRTLAFNDDHADKGAGLHTHHADSYVRVALPADGAYEVHVGDARRHGGPAYAYRLRVGPPRPDFRLRVAPSTLNLRGCQSEALTVYALRDDGFAGPIRLALADAPAGFVLGGGVIPAGRDEVRVTLTAPQRPSPTPYALHLEGRAGIEGREVVRPAVPAEDLMQAFAYRHLVPSEALLAGVSGRGMGRGPVRILGRLPLRIPAGGTASVRVGVPAETPMGRVELELNDPPDGIARVGIRGSNDRQIEVSRRQDGIRDIGKGPDCRRCVVLDEGRATGVLPVVMEHGPGTVSQPRAFAVNGVQVVIV
jgi:hypothetical protein